MSSLHISILCTLLILITADNRTSFFTNSNYDLWCQENTLSNAIFLYPDRIPIGIFRTSNIKSVSYQLIGDDNNGLFQIKTRRLADFYFLILNITRPFDINREYQDVYTLRIQANIITTEENQTEQTELRLHVADSNDNDGVFDMDIYEQNYTQTIELSQSLLRLHASDADGIQHAQILYESTSSFNETFSLHPYTGELYLISRENLKSSYEFDIYAYDRYRKRLVDNNMKTKTHVKLNFNLSNQTIFAFQTIDNQTIQYDQLLSSYDIKIFERTSVNLLNIHQPILTIETKPMETSLEIFLLHNSSLNTKNLFISTNEIYLNQYPIEEYNLQLLICFNHRSQCQYTKHRLSPLIDMNFYEFHFQSMEKIYLDENLPVDSFITRIQLDDRHLHSQQSLVINYKLINDEKDFRFYLHPKTGILRLAERLEYRMYSLDIQANIQLSNRRYSIETTIEIHVREMNKYRPIFRNNTPVEFFQLPYQFQAIDYDQDRETNGRISYRLWNCVEPCPFDLDPDNGTLIVRKSLENRIYYLEIVTFDWGQPISLESSLQIQVDLSSRLHKRDVTRARAYSRRWKKKTTINPFTTTLSTEKSLYTTTSPSNIDTVYLNVGFRDNISSYSLSEDAGMNTIIDHFKVEYDSFPLNIDTDKENIFFYTINDTNVPFIIDQNDRSIRLIDRIDREKQDTYIFEIELKLKSIYAMKLQENLFCSKKNSQVNFQYTNRFYRKMLVIIHINDVNDNIPQCQTFHSRISFNENQLQKNLFRIQATDPDRGENGTIIYSLFDHEEYFSIDTSTGQIDCIKSIDREFFSSIDLHIIASDQGTHPQYQSICTTLHITLNDLNDNTPQFLSSNFIFHLFSDMPRYSIFGQVSAIDYDQHDQLIYSLSPNPYVTINNFTGHLRLKHHLHRLIDQILNVTVYVSDGQHRNQTIIQIFIRAFPDAQEPILLPEPAFALTINESIPIGTMISNVYRRFQLVSSTIDLIEIVSDGQRKLPFSIDQQGQLRLTDSLIGLSKSSYWLSLRLTRFRAHPPHTFIHVHLSIRQENFAFPQCQDLYQTIRVYDYATQYPFAQIQPITFNKQSLVQYSLDNNEKIFAINKQTGFLHLLPAIHTQRRLKPDYLLTTNIFDPQSKLSTSCYVKVQLIRRRQLIPQFFAPAVYRADLPEITAGSSRLRQRLFQVIALLNPQVYDRKLEIRYRFTDINHHFIINRQTGYIAAKQPLNPYTTYEFNVEAFTVAYRDEILSDGNENDDDEHSNRGKWRIVSSRLTLPIQLRILPLMSLNQSIPSNIDSTINIDLLRTTEVGSIILHLGLNNQMNDSQWFIMNGHIRHTRYFHVDFQKGQLILIRPIDELINQTDLIELGINVTKDWVNMNTIKVIVRLVNNQIPTIKFSQTDYYSSVSKSIPIGVEIAHVTIENPAEDCLYSIDSVERLKSKDLFRINPYTGSISVQNSLETSSNPKHLLTILYRCEHQPHIAHTKLHINILDEKTFVNQTKKSFRFVQENYLIIFPTTLIPNQKKSLVDLQLINDEGIIKLPQAKITHGDPLGLFSIDTLNQSLILLDESLSRSYIYPIKLTVIDTSEVDSINTTVVIFISNIGIHFPCPEYLENSPFLFTYQSLPLESIDPITGWKRKAYQSLIIRAFDPFTPLNGEASNQAECIINSPEQSSTLSTMTNLQFLFPTELYSGYVNHSFARSSYVYNDQQEPLQIQVKTPNPSFDITYHFPRENFLQLDEYAGLMTLHSTNQTFDHHYSFLIYAKYHSFITFTRLNLRVDQRTSFDRTSSPSIYEFQLYTPFVNNYTIGYLNKSNEDWVILNEQIQPMIAIENYSGRLFVKNRTLLLTNGNFYDFLIQDRYAQISRVQIVILISTEPMIQCRLHRFNDSNTRQLIGFIEIVNENQTNSICDLKGRKSFQLLNYNHLFALDRQHGLLYYRNQSQILDEDLLLLIQIDRSRCLLNLDRMTSEVFYRMIRNDSQLQRQYHLDQSTGQMQFGNGTVLKYGIIPSRSPIFSANAYQFILNLLNTTMNKPIYLEQISAEPYDIHQSHLVYEFVDKPKHFLLNIDNGMLEYVPSASYNQTIERFQVIARDLIYQQTTTVNLTIDIIQPTVVNLSRLIYHQTVSEILPPGSVIFQPNISTVQNLRYSLRDHNRNLFDINLFTGRVTLRNSLTDRFYSFKIHLSPINEILIVKITVNDYNNHPPRFLNLPSNLSLSSSDSFITKLSAYDLDLPDNQKLRYHLLDSDRYGKFFSLNSSNGILTLTNHSLSKTSFQLNLGVSDGLYLTKNYLQIHFFDYAKHLPSFSSTEYLFQYDPSREILGQISAYDPDLNDRISYELYLQPNEIQIDPITGVIRVKKGFFSQPIVEFIASAMDLAKQIVYTKIQFTYSIQPKFQSNVFFVNLLRKDLVIPSEIFQFELVDPFNQPLKSAKCQLRNETNFFEIIDNKLLIRENPPYSTDSVLNINAYWKNFILQTAVRVQFVENISQLEKKFYSIFIDKSTLKEHFLLEEFPSKNLTLQIRSTPLTKNDCHDNFYIQQDKLFFRTWPILSDLCFFQLQLTDNISSSASQVQISFGYSNLPPKFSSGIYHFHLNDHQNSFRVFANGSNPIRYQLQNNSDGFFIHQTDGIITYKYGVYDREDLQLAVFAIDDRLNVNDTALIEIVFNGKRSWQMPGNDSAIPRCSNRPMMLSDQSLPGTVIQDISRPYENISSIYYILSGDDYGLFAINNLGQLYLTSPILNQTSEEHFQLIILISSLSSISYCRTNVSIQRTPRWSYLICPAMPIQWMIEEERPIGTSIGTVKEILLFINNSSQLIDQLSFKITDLNQDAQSFLLNSQTGVITSNTRLDYEQKSTYAFSISLEPMELNCSISIVIKLINIDDNPIVFNASSLRYNITENNPVPFYIGRVDIIDIDRLFTSNYEFYLRDFSEKISVDPSTGSIILYHRLDREYHGAEMTYEIVAIDRNHQATNLTNTLTISLHDINDHGPKFSQDLYSINISKSLRIGSSIFQLNATSADPFVNGRMTFSLRNSSDYFLIESETGIIRLKQSLPSVLTNVTLTIEVMESDVNLTNQTNLFISIVNDDQNYFDFHQRNRCFLDENQPIGTVICTIGKNSNAFIYEFLNPQDNFQILENNGTIISRKVFDHETDLHQYHLTILVRDRDNQSVSLSSLNLTIHLQNLNDNPSKFLTKNSSTIIYFYYPSIQTNLHRIEAFDADQSILTLDIINNSFYSLRSLPNNTFELILIQPIVTDREDHLIIRLQNNQTSNSLDLHLHFIYLQSMISESKILPQTIDGYVDFDDNISTINFGQLTIENQSQYPFIHYDLVSNQPFSLKQISNNQTELYLHRNISYSHQQKHRLLQFQIELTVIAINQTIPTIDFHSNPIIHLLRTPKSQSIDIHLWPIDREMLDRTLSLLINLHPQSTYEQFVIQSLPLIREYLAEMIGVNIRHVHIYTFEQKSSHQIELLIAIIRYPSRLRPPRYIHKKLLYNALKNSSHFLEKTLHIQSIARISINQCQPRSCENNGRCTSQIKLHSNEFNYFTYNSYTRLIPKYQWNIKCLCLNHFYGQYCQFKQDYQSPCSSNPCSAVERCIDESSTLYSCQCIDEPCQLNEISLDCININSPTCRDASNTLTFDGYSFVRMNSTMNFTKHFNLTFTFRTQVAQGKFIILSDQDKSYSLVIQINNGYVNVQLNEKIIFQIEDIQVNDGLWHQIFFSMDYLFNHQQYYYLLRLDHVFSNKITSYQPKFAHQVKEFLIGNEFHGCLGNLSFNNHLISLHKQSNNPLLEHIGTNDGCQLAEIETRTLRQFKSKEDLCSLYNPCYHGGVCSSINGVSFTCDCLKPRFAGRQCQRDLEPCRSHPCLFDEQCVPSSAHQRNLTYSCLSSLLSLPMSTKNPLYIGLAVTICTLILCVLLILSLIIYCQQQRKERKRKIHLAQDKPSVSAPLLMPKSPPLSPGANNTIESPMQTLLKVNANGKSTVETTALVDNNHTSSGMNNFNDKQSNNQLNKSSLSIDKPQHHNRSQESLNHRRSDPKYYSAIGRMNIPPDNFLPHYNGGDYDTSCIPLVDPQSTDLFDFPSSPTKYFNGHKEETAAHYQVRINSLSNFTEKLAEQNDMELTHSSNDSSNNEQTLLTSPISNGERKRSLFNVGSAQNIRASSSSLQKAPVYAKVIKTSSKTTNGGMSTIERLRLSGSPLRLLSSSPTYARTTSFFKGNDTDHMQSSTSSSTTKNNKITPTSWKLNPRKLDSLKARRHSRQTDDEDDHETNNETSQLTINRLRHASESDLTKGSLNGKKSTKLSSFFQTEV